MFASQSLPRVSSCSSFSTVARKEAVRLTSGKCAALLAVVLFLAQSGAAQDGKNSISPRRKDIAPQAGVDTSHVDPDIRGAIAGQKAPSAQVLENYGKLPLSFEMNQGQADSRVRFLSRGVDRSLFLTSDSAVLQLSRAESSKGGAPLPPSGGQESSILRLQLLGSSDSVRISGEEQLPGKTNYLIGTDPKAWHTNVTTFSKVRYEGVYPGVDLVYYGNQQRLEYDFVVAPGADPNAIRMRIEGARKLEVDRVGGLIVHLSDGDVRWERPTCYQLNEGRRVPVGGRFVVSGNRVRFHVDSYDRTRQLVIDPVLAYSTYIGAVSNQRLGVAVDASGSLYVGTTSTSVSPYPTTAGAYQTSNAAGVISGTITKLSADGTTLVYSTYLGNGINTDLYGLAVDAAGDAYVTGSTNIGFPTTTLTAYQAQCAVQPTVPPSCTPNPAFVAELNPQGNGLVYSTYLTGSTLGGQTSSSGVGVTVDASGNIYVVGVTTDPTFPPVNAYQAALADDSTTCQGACGDFFVAKLGVPSAGGNMTLLYSTYLGGSFQDSPEIANGGGNVIATDGTGKVFVGGYTASSNFPFSANAYKKFCGTAATLCSTTSGFQNRNDGVFFELDTTQSGAASLVYSTYIGGSSQDSVSAIALDSTSKAYLAGWTQSSDFYTTNGAFQTNCSSINQNPFVMKFDTTQSGAASVLWSTCLGFNGAAYGLALGSAGDIYVSTDTNDGIFPATNLVNPIQSDTGSVYIGELNTTGTSLLWGTRFGGSTAQANAGIALDSSSNVYIAGVTTFFGSSTDLPTTLGSFSPNCIIGTNAAGCGVASTGAPALFAAKIASTNGTFPVATPRSLSFAALAPGSPSPSQNFVFRNIGDTSLTINSITISGTNASDFSIVAPAGCTTGTLAGGASCTDSIVFTPQASGNRQATLTIDPTGVLDSVALTGIGTPTTAPVASNVSVSTLTNTPVSIPLQATDSAGFSLTYSIVSAPTSGTLGAVSGSTVTYTPNAGFTGSDSFTYMANDGYLNSNVATVSITVANANSSTTTIVSSSPNPSNFGQTVTLTATVTSTGGTPTGTVTFMDGANSLGGATLTSGAASLTTSTLTAGSHSITVSYAGATGFAASTSSPLTQIVTKAAPVLAWPTPAAITYGTPISATQLNATANIPGTFAYTPASGTVLGAGTQTLSLTFTPTDSTDYSTATTSVSLAVNKASATVGLSSSANPSVPGQSVTFTATISLQSGGTATGIVTFSDGATILSTVTVSSNSAAFSTSGLAMGSHSISASYSGDSNVLSAVSGAVSQVVNSSSVATSTTVASSANPAVFGQQFFLAATVTSASGTPTGEVSFFDGATLLGTATITSGSAKASVGPLVVGIHQITANFSGDSTHLPSTSAVLSEAVNQATTTTAVTSSQNPQRVGGPITLTAYVTGQFGGVTTGTVTFRAGTTVLGTATLSGNMAAITTSFATPGTRPISAQYGGDANDLGSTSTVLSQSVVNTIPTTIMLVSSPNSSFIGQAIMFTATITSSGGTPQDGELITFTIDGDPLGTAPLVSGSASFTTSALPLGLSYIRARYPGDTVFAASASSVLRQTVTKYLTATSLASSLNPSTFGQSVTLTARVTSSGPAISTGNVVFRNGNTNLGSVALNSSGVATLTRINLPAGILSLTATYNGDSQSAKSSASLTQTVNQASSTTSLTSSTNPSTFGQSVTFRATVTTNTGITAAGTVTFTSGTTTLGTVTLVEGRASFSTTALPRGANPITATYNGTADVVRSSASLTAQVN